MQYQGPARTRGFVLNVGFWIGLGMIPAAYAVGGLIALLPADVSALGFSGNCGPSLVVLLAAMGEHVDPLCVNAAVGQVTRAVVVGGVLFVAAFVALGVGLTGRRRP